VAVALSLFSWLPFNHNQLRLPYFLFVVPDSPSYAYFTNEWKTINLKHEARPPGLPALSLSKGPAIADYFLSSLHNDSRSLPSNIVLGVHFTPHSIRKPPNEAKTSRNSLCWTILQGTPLF
jgi:hypothetical protein